MYLHISIEAADFKQKATTFTFFLNSEKSNFLSYQKIASEQTVLYATENTNLHGNKSTIFSLLKEIKSDTVLWDVVGGHLVKDTRQRRQATAAQQTKIFTVWMKHGLHVPLGLFRKL